MKVKAEKRKPLCPICGEELVKLNYLGFRVIVRDRNRAGFVGSFLDDLVDGNASADWCEAPSESFGRFGSGSYEEKDY